MTDPTPLQSPAARLAAVLRALDPSSGWEEISEDTVAYHNDDCGRWCSYNPTSKDDLARVVEMLTREQADRFNRAMAFSTGDRTGQAYDRVYVWPSPARAITAPPESWLAALEAAVKE